MRKMSHFYIFLSFLLLNSISMEETDSVNAEFELNNEDAQIIISVKYYTETNMFSLNARRSADQPTYIGYFKPWPINFTEMNPIFHLPFAIRDLEIDNIDFLEVKWATLPSFVLKKDGPNTSSERSMAYERAKKKEYLAKYAVAQATILGETFDGITTSIFKIPRMTGLKADVDGYSYSSASTWMTIQFIRITSFNHLIFRLWDGDARTYTYTIEASSNGQNWESLYKEKQGKSLQILDLGREIKATQIRIKGTTDIANNQYLHLLKFKIKYIPI